MIFSIFIKHTVGVVHPTIDRSVMIERTERRMVLMIPVMRRAIPLMKEITETIRKRMTARNALEKRCLLTKG